jgi:hypothetical protein
MGVGEWFRDFNLGLRVTKAEDISYRYRRITRQLNSDFWNTESEVSHSLYVGSYGRNTAIHDVSDIDVVFELPSSVYAQYNAHFGNGQSALLQAVKSSIERTYATTSLRADGQVIVVPFNDGISFEVQPVFVNTVGSYTFPDANSGGTWKVTNPRPEIEAIRNRNAACNGNLVHLCRMTRAWKRTWDVPIGGLLIDTLAYQFIENYEHREQSFFYHDLMSRDFFRWLADQDESQDFWKAPGSGQWVYGKGLFQYKAKRCYNISLEAIAHESTTPKQEWSAKQKWRDIYGYNFPA